MAHATVNYLLKAEICETASDYINRLWCCGAFFKVSKSCGCDAWFEDLGRNQIFDMSWLLKLLCEQQPKNFVESLRTTVNTRKGHREIWCDAWSVDQCCLVIVLTSVFQEVKSGVFWENNVVVHVCLYHIFDILWVLIEKLCSVHFTSVVDDDANSLIFKYRPDLLWCRLREIQTNYLSLNRRIYELSLRCHSFKISCRAWYQY